MTTLDRTTAAQLDALERDLVLGMPALLSDVCRLLEQDWPDYARFLAQERDEVVVATRAFVDRLLEVARTVPDGGAVPLELDAISGELFEAIGGLQWREGRDLTTLLTAYQAGARAAWWHVSKAALRLELEGSMLATLAATVFEFVGELSSLSARGYAREQSESARARERLRDELSQLLLSGRATQSGVAAAAAAAGWPLPREAAVVLVDPDDQGARAVIERTGSECLRASQEGLFGLIVPDPSAPGRQTRLRKALRGAHAVIGHPVPLSALPASTNVALVAQRLTRSGVLDGDPVVVEDCLDTIIVHADDGLLGALRRQVLAPLEQFVPATRERLTGTLTCWLRHAGDRQAVAHELQIHPHTVRYRLAQLRNVFGSGLDQPDQRARLLLALNWGPPGADEEPPSRARR
ncbi:MAG TPA: helix-turn-helix domain-containing protein [Kribbella sp.]|nr:helix-turn-helix domain-containing protein [Kribbella sp.]